MDSGEYDDEFKTSAAESGIIASDDPAAVLLADDSAIGGPSDPRSLMVDMHVPTPATDLSEGIHSRGQDHISGSSREGTPDPAVLRLKRANAKLRQQLKEITRLMDVDIRRKAARRGKNVKAVNRDADPQELASRLNNTEKKLRAYKKENSKLKRIVAKTSKSEAITKLENLIHEQELKLKAIISENKTMKKERRRLMKAMDELNEDGGGYSDQLRNLENEVRMYREKYKKYARKCEDQDRNSRKQKEYLVKVEDRLRKLKNRLKNGQPLRKERSSKYDVEKVERLQDELEKAKDTLNCERKKVSRIMRTSERMKAKQANEISRLEALVADKDDQLKRQVTILRSEVQQMSTKLREKDSEVKLQAIRLRELQSSKSAPSPLPPAAGSKLPRLSTGGSRKSLLMTKSDSKISIRSSKESTLKLASESKGSLFPKINSEVKGKHTETTSDPMSTKTPTETSPTREKQVKTEGASGPGAKMDSVSGRQAKEGVSGHEASEEEATSPEREALNERGTEEDAVCEGEGEMKEKGEGELEEKDEGEGELEKDEGEGELEEKDEGEGELEEKDEGEGELEKKDESEGEEGKDEGVKDEAVEKVSVGETVEGETDTAGKGIEASEEKMAIPGDGDADSLDFNETEDYEDDFQ
ncbi:hypothetical protein AAMO2058_001100600 [Amorphochlora amoebiformis]